MERVPADVVHQVVHAGFEAGALEEPGQAGADAGSDGGGDGNPFPAARDLRAIDANVQLAAPFFAYQREVAADRLQLSIDGGGPQADQRAGVGAGQIAAGEERGDEPRGSFDGGEPSEVRVRHDPLRII